MTTPPTPGELGPPDPTRFPALSSSFVRTLPAGHLVGRIFFAGGQYPVAWNQFRSHGPVRTCRFDHHPPPPGDHPARAILYAAPLVHDVEGVIVPPLDTCLAEVFGATGVVDRHAGAPAFAVFRLARDVSSLDLVDSNWVTAARTTAGLFGGPHTHTQDWSRAIYDHYADDPPDGLFYGAAHMPRGRSIAFFERARDALPTHHDVRLPLADPALTPDLEAACARLSFLLL